MYCEIRSGSALTRREQAGRAGARRGWCCRGCARAGRRSPGRVLRAQCGRRRRSAIHAVPQGTTRPRQL